MKRTIQVRISRGHLLFGAECLDLPVVTQAETVPNHDEIDRGTLHAIYRQASRFIPEGELHDWFFTE
jgi:hypothetical protein